MKLRVIIRVHLGHKAQNTRAASVSRTDEILARNFIVRLQLAHRQLDLQVKILLSAEQTPKQTTQPSITGSVSTIHATYSADPE